MSRNTRPLPKRLAVLLAIAQVIGGLQAQHRGDAGAHRGGCRVIKMALVLAFSRLPSVLAIELGASSMARRHLDALVDGSAVHLALAALAAREPVASPQATVRRSGLSMAPEIFKTPTNSDKVLFCYAAGERDFAGAHLRGANLSGANLSGADLTGADLTGANLAGADLRGAHLCAAHLSGADLSGANLSGADLSGAYLVRAYLDATNLIRAQLIDADLCGTYLRGACLCSANLGRANLSGAYLRGANLVDASLIGANLGGAHLSGVYLHHANLHGASLVGADLHGASLVGTDLSETNLLRASFRGANLRRVNFRGAKFHSGTFVDAASAGLLLFFAYLLGDAKFRGAGFFYVVLIGILFLGTSLFRVSLLGLNLRRALFDGALVASAVLFGANLRGASLVGASLVGAAFVGATVRDAIRSAPDGGRVVTPRQFWYMLGSRPMERVAAKSALFEAYKREDATGCALALRELIAEAACKPDEARNDPDLFLLLDQVSDTAAAESGGADRWLAGGLAFAALIGAAGPILGALLAARGQPALIVAWIGVLGLAMGFVIGFYAVMIARAGARWKPVKEKADRLMSKILEASGRPLSSVNVRVENPPLPPRAYQPPARVALPEARVEVVSEPVALPEARVDVSSCTLESDEHVELTSQARGSVSHD